MDSRFSILCCALVIAAGGATAVWAGPGDLNCDGRVDGADGGPFVTALIDPAGYEAAYPNCGSSEADFDCDGAAGTGDVHDFVTCMLSGVCSTCTPPGMVRVHVGSFVMGDVRHEGQEDELPPHEVQLDSFYMDVHEVTNAQYAAGLNWAWAQGNLITVSNGIVRGSGSPPQPYCDTTSSSSFSQVTWNGSTFGVVSGMEDHPVVMVSWYGAAAYCNWRSAMTGRDPCFDLALWACDFGKNGFRLPTEAEWEKAARWDAIQPYPYRFSEQTDGCGANCLNGQRANYGTSGDPFEGGSYPLTTPVGYYDGSNHGGYQTQDAQSTYGCRDMSGNVWEWCYDWHSSTYYSTSPSTNPTGPAAGTERSQRGGSWYNAPVSCRSAMRNRHAPVDRNPNDGFRCAAGVP